MYYSDSQRLFQTGASKKQNVSETCHDIWHWMYLPHRALYFTDNTGPTCRTVCSFIHCLTDILSHNHLPDLRSKPERCEELKREKEW